MKPISLVQEPKYLATLGRIKPDINYKKQISRFLVNGYKAS